MAALRLALIAIAGMAQPAAARKVALVIGISQYQAVQSLTNPQIDADVVSKALRDDGFDVTELTQPAQVGRKALYAAILAFRRNAAGAEAAVVYFAGHGVEAGGHNWLLPADVNVKSLDELDTEAIPSANLVEAVAGASAVRLVILDACRDNPLPIAQSARSVGPSRGLAREANLPPNVVVLLATQPGLKANDGEAGANSPFARALSAALTSENLRISSLPTMVSRQMRQLSGVDQRPDLQGIFDDPDWMFRAGAALTRSTATTTMAAALPPPAPMQVARGYGLVLQSRVDGGPGLLVAEVAGGSPFDGSVQAGDVILKLNSATPPAPQSVITTLQRDHRASINLQHGGRGVPTSTELTLPKDLDE